MFGYLFWFLMLESNCIRIPCFITKEHFKNRPFIFSPRLSLNGKQRLKILPLRLMPAKRNAAISTVSSSGWRQLMMKQLSSLMLSRGRTRIWLMRSETSLTSLVMEDAQFMSLTSSVGAWRLKRKSSKQPLKKLRQRLSKKKIRFFAHNLSLAKSGRRLIAESRRRKRNLTLLGMYKAKSIFLVILGTVTFYSVFSQNGL